MVYFVEEIERYGIWVFLCGNVGLDSDHFLETEECILLVGMHF